MAKIQHSFAHHTVSHQKRQDSQWQSHTQDSASLGKFHQHTCRSYLCTPHLNVHTHSHIYQACQHSMPDSQNAAQHRFFFFFLILLCEDYGVFDVHPESLSLHYDFSRTLFCRLLHAERRMWTNPWVGSLKTSQSVSGKYVCFLPYSLVKKLCTSELWATYIYIYIYHVTFLTWVIK